MIYSMRKAPQTLSNMIIDSYRFGQVSGVFNGFGNNSREFDGVAQSLAMDDVFPVIGTTLSFAAWAKVDSFAAPGNSLLDMGDSSLSYQSNILRILYVGPTNQLVFQVRDAAGNFNEVRLNNANSYTGWRHYAITRSGDLVTAYIDGVSVGSDSTNALGSHATTHYFSVGALRNAVNPEGNYFFTGNIADVRLYDSELTAIEVADIASGVDYQTNLIGHWLKDTDSLEDFIGVNDAYNHGASSFSTDGPIPANSDFGDNSRDFDGESDFLARDSDFMPTGAQTWAFWLKLNSYGSGLDVMGRWDAGNGERSALIYASGAGFLGFYTSETGTSAVSSIYSASPFGTGTWRHVVATYEPSNSIKIYVDGVLRNNTTSSVPSSLYDPLSLEFRFANRADPNTNLWLDGKVADARIYDAVIPTAEIANLMAGTDYTTNLVAHWFKNTDDVIDHSGNGYDMTSDNASTYSTDGPAPP